MQFNPSGGARSNAVLHRQGDLQIPVEHGRELAACIPDAKFIEYPGGDHTYATGDVEAGSATSKSHHGASREFLADFERVLATVLFRISSFDRAAPHDGRRAWRNLLDRHDELALQVVEKHRGTLIKSTG